MNKSGWVQVYPDRESGGQAAAGDVAAELRRLIGAQGSARVVFASAPSQLEMLQALAREPDIDWGVVEAFHMDEYLGLPSGDSPAGFGNWLVANFLRAVPMGEVHLIAPGPQPEEAVGRYTELLTKSPIDVVCLGIGVNGHIAFNDPGVADFDDPRPVKVVELDDVCRQQQVDDGCFPSMADVPRSAITVTIPTLLSARRLFCVVPGPAKAEAVRSTVVGRLSTECPGTILRTHPGCTLYLDSESAAALRDALVV